MLVKYTRKSIIWKYHVSSFGTDIVGTVYHLVIYMQSNKIHNVVLMSKFYSALMLAVHVSDLACPSSGAFCTSCIRRLWYVVIRVVLDTLQSCRKKCSSSYKFVTCRVVRTVLPHTKVCEYSLYKTLLMMDRRGPKHVQLT